MSKAQLSKTRRFPTQVDLPEDARAKVIDLLNQNLADTFDLMSQTKQAHWNVKGKDFYQLHLLFDEIAAELAGFVDEIAERATSLGGYATGTVRMAAGSTRLPEYPVEATAGMEHVAALTERFGIYANTIREAIDEADGLDDKTTADLFTQISRTADKRLWFLEAHIQNAEEA